MNLLDEIRTRSAARATDPDLSFEDWIGLHKFAYQFGGLPFGQTLVGNTEAIAPDFESLAAHAYGANAVVFACMNLRARVFSEARLTFRRLRDGRPTDLFGTPALALLERPWVNGTTGELLQRMIVDADLGGNAFIARPRGEKQLFRLRPDRVAIALASKSEPKDPQKAWDAEVVGYVYQAPGSASAKVFSPDEVVHWSPIPDPLSASRGMSWLTPILREIRADTAATEHKAKFFDNGATPNLVFSLDPGVTLEQLRAFKAEVERNHAGRYNAYRSLFLGGGAKVQVVGSDLKQLDFKLTQGAGETRIAAAAGTPAGLVGLSEGLAANTYSNLSQARRVFTDGTLSPLWRQASAALAPLVAVPPGAELWYDARDIPFLQEDQKDAAEIQQMEAATIRQLVEAGFDADSVVKAVLAGDFKLLTHSGLFSVQLQAAGESAPAGPTKEPTE